MYFIVFISLSLFNNLDGRVIYTQIRNFDKSFFDGKLGNPFFIYPGTKWCGVGDIADDYNDLGELRDTDKCCRQHDNCAETIEKFQTSSKYNLTNDRFFTSLSCDCDEIFYQCLKSIRTNDSNLIGFFYFNVIGQQCFRKENKIKRCLTYVYAPAKCTEYEVETDGNKIYQWFDVPLY